MNTLKQFNIPGGYVSARILIAGPNIDRTFKLKIYFNYTWITLGAVLWTADPDPVLLSQCGSGAREPNQWGSTRILILFRIVVEVTES
jgi:hypothetical protein